MWHNYEEDKHLFISMPEGGGSATVLGYGKEALHKCMQLNDKKNGAFITVNGFDDMRRKKENLVKINAWAIDMDEGTKESQKETIKKSPITPSLIVETKNGFHCYWKARNATVVNFNRIMENLVEQLNADKRAKDLCRFLRIPSCWHWKDPNNPYLVKEVHRTNKEFDEEQMIRSFCREEKPVKKATQRTYTRIKGNADFGECMKGLEMLSGAVELNGDMVSFSNNADGTKQIWVNGESTSSWIGLDGHIGSHDRGGPGLVHWVEWYGLSRDEAHTVLKKHLGGEYERILRKGVC